MEFQSTLPARGATCWRRILYHIWEFQSTLPARGATLKRWDYWERQAISIHAPRTGSDTAPRQYCPPQAHFNPRSPHGERQYSICVICLICAYFNPRSPHGERLRCGAAPISLLAFQSTLPARGATSVAARCDQLYCISIHAPRTGSDYVGGEYYITYGNFNPRSPHGERRKERARYTVLRKMISIHAPRTGSDFCTGKNRHETSNFNPRSPHGERRRFSARPLGQSTFQSTLPARGATTVLFALFVPEIISIHAPRTGSDDESGDAVKSTEISIHAPRTGSDGIFRLRSDTQTYNFNPRSPHGERRVPLLHLKREIGISIHAPRTGSDIAKRELLIQSSDISIHAPRTGSDSIPNATNRCLMQFQSTLPARGATHYRRRHGVD